MFQFNSLSFNNIQVSDSSSEKLLEEQLAFCKHVKMEASKVNKFIGILHKLQILLPKSVLLTINKVFIRSYLDMVIQYTTTPALHLFWTENESSAVVD